MGDPGLVGSAQGVGDVAEETRDLLEGQRSPLAQRVGEATALAVLHDDEDFLPGRPAEIVDGHHVRVLQPAGLGPEALQGGGARHGVGAEDLEGGQALRALGAGGVDGPLATGPDDLEDPIATLPERPDARVWGGRGHVPGTAAKILFGRGTTLRLRPNGRPLRRRAVGPAPGGVGQGENSTPPRPRCVSVAR